MRRGNPEKMNTELPNLTPLMQQYFDIKRNYPDALLLFQVGDFYELFYDDAKKAAACLAIALTARGKNNGDPIPLCGVPVHALDHYLAKLIRHGFKVVLCNQLEPATPGKVVARGVTQVFTPGTLTDSALLDEKSASYLFSFFPDTTFHGLVFGELLTAQIFATVLSPQQSTLLESELSKFLPDEIIIPSTVQAKDFERYFSKLGYYTTTVGDRLLDQEASLWSKQFTQQAQHYLEKYDTVQKALYNFYGYLRKNQVGTIDHFKQLNIYSPEEFLSIDSATQRNLELVKNMYDGSRKNSLFEVLDGAVTAMGSRTIKKWLLRPLLSQEGINQRQEVVDCFVSDVVVTQRLRVLLQSIGDAERVIGRIVLNRGTVSDYLALLAILKIIPEIYSCLQQPTMASLLRVLANHLHPPADLVALLSQSLNTDSAKEWIITAGFDEQLDSLRTIIEKSSLSLLALEKREQEKTNIGSLKVRYNTIQGYYIEITKPNAHLVPKEYIRMQSLVGKERFTTIELKNLEIEINEARAHIDHVEKAIFEKVKRTIVAQASLLRKIAQGLSQLDALFGLAQVAYTQGYVRPSFNNEQKLLIKQGKHPVIAAHSAHHFIANDTELNDEKSLWVITGPNMGGKSTYLRQVALISIMAQIGSFVPAKEANLSILDRVFTRIGAGDNVSGGKSTFLVEMEETAIICAQATPKSLIILDEIGRGTSTFDGLAIAQAVIEYIYTIIKARCLFATHYHELSALPKQFPGIVSYHAASKKTPSGILLLYAILEGSADGSFGIDVAKLAHMPESIIKRAEELLQTFTDPTCEIEQKSFHGQTESKHHFKSLLDQKKELFSPLFDLDFNNITPRQAFDILWKIRENLN